MTSILAGQPILIVEDEALVALDMAHSFEAVGAQVVTAFSLDEALELIDGHDWKGAVLDYWLDSRDCSRVCELLNGRAIPFVICSGYPQVAGLCARGVQVPKPADPDEILSIMEQLATAPRLVA